MLDFIGNPLEELYEDDEFVFNINNDVNDEDDEFDFTISNEANDDNDDVDYGDAWDSQNVSNFVINYIQDQDRSFVNEIVRSEGTENDNITDDSSVTTDNEDSEYEPDDDEYIIAELFQGEFE